MPANFFWTFREPLHFAAGNQKIDRAVQSYEVECRVALKKSHEQIVDQDELEIVNPEHPKEELADQKASDGWEGFPKRYIGHLPENQTRKEWE